MNIFSEAQIKDFHNKGFAIIDLDVDFSVLNKIIVCMDKQYDERQFINGKYNSGTRIQDGWLDHDSVYTIAALPKVLNVLKQLFGRNALPFQTLNFPVGTQQRAHSDTIHFNSTPNGFMAGVWVALEDIDLNNGPLIYYPKSHKLQEYNMQDCGLDNGYEYYSEYENFISNKIKALNLKPEYGFLKKGQAFIWHANLLHGGSKHKDKNRSRHSQVTHYYFENCRYYTPMKSTKTHIAYRSPIWICKPKSINRFFAHSKSKGRKLVKNLLGVFIKKYRS